MNITRLLPAITLPGLLLLAQPAKAQVTNWQAFNDHRQGTTTGPNVSRYDMRGTADRGQLTDISTGTALPVRLLVSDMGRRLRRFWGMRRSGSRHAGRLALCQSGGRRRDRR